MPGNRSSSLPSKLGMLLAGLLAGFDLFLFGAGFSSTVTCCCLSGPTLVSVPLLFLVLGGFVVGGPVPEPDGRVWPGWWSLSLLLHPLVWFWSLSWYGFDFEDRALDPALGVLAVVAPILGLVWLGEYTRTRDRDQAWVLGLLLGLAAATPGLIMIVFGLWHIRQK